jgi:Glycosyltransferase family 9 (heptosyltransferase)
MNTSSNVHFIDQDSSENNSAFVQNNVRSDLPTRVSQKGNVDHSRFLVTMYKGIGDAVLVGLSIIDQLIKEEPKAFGKIDVLCNSVQSEIFEHDPRINRIILTNSSFFSPSEMTMWLNGIKLDAETTQLVQFLQDKQYAAVFAFMFAPGFYLRLQAPIVYPNVLHLWKDYQALSRQVDVPMYKITRQMVSNYFGKKPSLVDITDETPLYIDSKHVKNAMAIVRNIKEQFNVSPETSRLLVVASDSTSVVTRPPVDLLATSIAEALRNCHNLVACILQGYTDTNAAIKLFKALADEFQSRIFFIPAEPRAKLLDVAAFIDQSDIFVTGDTGLMHIAVANKKLSESNETAYFPKNAVKIIALFGGTNPGFYGYSDRTIIVGKGRKEQTAFVPGIAKESFNPKGKNLFDHISPHQLTDAILS